MRLASIRFAVAAALAASILPLQSLAGSMSLTVEGIPMTIEVLSFNFGANNAGSFSSGGGGGVGKVKFNEFNFSSNESAASPAVFQMVNMGKHSQTARLSIMNPDTGKAQSEWVLTDVLVSSFAVQNGDPDPKAKQPNTFAIPVTAFGLNFAKVCYRVFAADGSVAKEACWDVVANAPL